MDTDINNFGRKSFVHTTGLKERIQEAEKEIQMRQYKGLTKEGKWVCGWYYKHLPSEKSFIKYYDTKSRMMINEEVIPESVGQFTDLKDKNGKEFYEGSLVQLQSQYETDEPIDCKVKIVFREGAFRLDFHNMLLNANIAASIGNWSTEIIEEQDNA